MSKLKKKMTKEELIASLEENHKKIEELRNKREKNNGK